MKVKILKGRGWYERQEGKTFEVKDERCKIGAFAGYYERIGMGGYMIDPANCEVVYDEPRLHHHEGKYYVVPEWAKYVTCDGNGDELWVWEHKPQHTFLGFNCVTAGKRAMMEEYVKPLPEGAFIVEI